MMDKGRKALLVGATGLVGGQLLNKLIHSPYYTEVVVLTRTRLGITNTKLKEAIFDFNQPDASQVVADDVYCCLGTTIKKAGSQEAFRKVDFQYPLEIAQMAKENGAKKYVIVTALGADATSSIFYSKVKGELEEALQKIGFEALHLVRPSLLLGDREERRVGEKIGEGVAKVLGPLMLGPLKKFKAIGSDQVAQAMLAFGKSGDKGVCVHNSDALQAY
jgi:uncharacterized protein YbjT (DUF2867 family)